MNRGTSDRSWLIAAGGVIATLVLLTGLGLLLWPGAVKVIWTGAALVGAVILAALVVGTAGSWALHTTFVQVNLFVENEKSRGVPAVFEFVGTVGIALTSTALSKWLGLGVSLGATAVSFIATSLVAQRDLNFAARFLATLGALMPLAVLGGVALASKTFAQLSLASKVIAVGSATFALLTLLYWLIEVGDARPGLELGADLSSGKRPRDET